MTKFGYPYNDLVICKDSNDYLDVLYNWSVSDEGDLFVLQRYFHQLALVELVAHTTRNGVEIAILRL